MKKIAKIIVSAFILIWGFSVSGCSQDIEIHDKENRVVFEVDASCKMSLTKSFSEAKLVVNGPLFDSQGNPDGGVIFDGKWGKEKVTTGSKIKDLEKNFNFGNLSGIFVLRNDNSIHIYHYQEDFSIKNVRFGFQSGPILVSNGRIPEGIGKIKLSQTIFPTKRAGIGYRGDKIIIIVSKEEISLDDFAKMFLDEGVDNALYLDGKNVVYRYKSKNIVGSVPKGASMIKID